MITHINFIWPGLLRYNAIQNELLGEWNYILSWIGHFGNQHLSKSNIHPKHGIDFISMRFTITNTMWTHHMRFNQFSRYFYFYFVGFARVQRLGSACVKARPGHVASQLGSIWLGSSFCNRHTPVQTSGFDSRDTRIGQISSFVRLPNKSRTGYPKRKKVNIIQTERITNRPLIGSPRKVGPNPVQIA